MFVPNFLLIGLTYFGGVRFAAHDPNLSFRHLIADASRRPYSLGEAIRSVTHLVLARGSR